MMMIMRRHVAVAATRTIMHIVGWRLLDKVSIGAAISFSRGWLSLDADYRARLDVRC